MEARRENGVLENAEVRAAAVSTLAKFGASCDHLLPNILVLLQRCQYDTGKSLNLVP